MKSPLQHIKKPSGFTVIELVVYISVMALIFSIIIFLLTDATRIMRKTKEAKDVRASALMLFERVTREVRDASSVDTSSSSLNTVDGMLTLDTYTESNVPTQISFFVDSDNAVSISQDGVYRGALTLPSVVVHELSFFSINNTRSEGVKIQAVLSHERDLDRRVLFETTTILRGSY